jgi:hypothetical protein
MVENRTEIYPVCQSCKDVPAQIFQEDEDIVWNAGKNEHTLLVKQYLITSRRTRIPVANYTILAAAVYR